MSAAFIDRSVLATIDTSVASTLLNLGRLLP
jgi:hypothetical protein